MLFYISSDKNRLLKTITDIGTVTFSSLKFLNMSGFFLFHAQISDIFIFCEVVIPYLNRLWLVS
jgi:hypothetical protein